MRFSRVVPILPRIECRHPDCTAPAALESRLREGDPLDSGRLDDTLVSPGDPVARRDFELVDVRVERRGEEL